MGRWLTEGGILARIFGLFFTNPLVLWFCAGISKGQLSLIRKEDNIYRSARQAEGREWRLPGGAVGRQDGVGSSGVGRGGGFAEE